MPIKRFLRFRYFKSCFLFGFSEADWFRKHVTIVPNTLLIVKTEAIGDYILFRNFLEVLRNSSTYGNYHITLCGNEAWKELALAYDSNFVDDFIWINRKKLGSDKAYRRQMLQTIASRGFEVAIQPTYSSEFLLGDSLIRATGAALRIGSLGDAGNDLQLLHSISRLWYTNLCSMNDAPIFEFSKNLLFFEEVLETSLTIHSPYLPVNKDNSNDSVMIFPGAGEVIKQWPAQRFGQLVQQVKELGITEFQICGSPADRKFGEEIQAVAGSFPLKNRCGETSLVGLVEAIASCRLLITNDSSAYHIAVAVGTPVICLLMGRHYGRFSPYPMRTASRVLEVYPQSFRPLLKQPFETALATRFNSPSNIEEITVNEVFEAVKDMLA